MAQLKGIKKHFSRMTLVFSEKIKKYVKLKILHGEDQKGRDIDAL